MANYATGDWRIAQVMLNGLMAAPEKRFRDPVVFKSIIASNKMFELIVDKTRDDRPTEANYSLRTARSLGTGRSHNHTGPQGDSALLTPSWVTRNDEFSETIKLADNKVFTAQGLFNNEIENVVANFAEGVEGVATDFIFDARSQVNTSTSEGAFDGTNFKFDITEATNGTRAIQITKSTMDINKYRGGNLIAYCDTVSFNKFEYQANQGGGNSENLSFQFSGITFIKSIEMDAKASGLSITKGLWAVVPFGTIGVADWIPNQNRLGLDFGGTVGKYGTMINPVDKLTYATHSYQTAVNGTSTGGYTQDVRIEHEISIDLAFDNAPLSTANESTIQLFALI